MENFKEYFYKNLNENSYKVEYEFDNEDTLLAYEDEEDYFGKTFAVQYTKKDGTTYGSGFDSKKEAEDVFNKIKKEPKTFKKFLKD